MKVDDIRERVMTMESTDVRNELAQLCDVVASLEANVSKETQAVFGLIQQDPHQWSDRPCPTCRAATSILGYKFGCDKYRADRQQLPTERRN